MFSCCLQVKRNPGTREYANEEAISAGANWPPAYNLVKDIISYSAVIIPSCLWSMTQRESKSFEPMIALVKTLKEHSYDHRLLYTILAL